MSGKPIQFDSLTLLALQGYRDAMTYIIQIAPDRHFEYNAQLLKGLHFMMTGYDLGKSPGQWRPGVVYVRNDETGEIVYEGAAAEDVPTLISELAEYLNAPSNAHRIVRAAMAHLNLVMVHPFRDGNGRMGRVLQSLVLARDGVLSPGFMSIEEYLGRNTRDYYEVLSEIGGGSWDPSRDARPWIRFNLTAHLRQATTMARRIDEAERLWDELERLVERTGVPDRSIHALYDAAMGWRVRRSVYRAVLEQVGEPISDQAATRDLKALVNRELLVPYGQKRGRIYRAADGVSRIRADLVRGRSPRDESDPFSGVA